jgi:hypothetical protein
MKAYVIMQKGYEYDDSIHNPVEGGTPQKVFFNKEDAYIEKNRLEIKTMKEMDITSYTYSIEDELNVEINELTSFLESLNEKYGKPAPVNKWDSLGEYQLNPMASDEEAKKFLSMHSIRFYEVVEVDVDVTSLRDTQIDRILS